MDIGERTSSKHINHKNTMYLLWFDITLDTVCLSYFVSYTQSTLFNNYSPKAK